MTTWGSAGILFGQRRSSKRGFGAFADFLHFHISGGFDADVVAALHFDDYGCAFAEAWD